MPRRKWIDKKTATHFTLVHRPQNDPLIHDDEAPSMVLNPTQLPNAAKGVSTRGSTISDLASQLGADADRIRANEGEAAEYGVYFDDTEYDYMQHLRGLGQGSGEAVFVEANPVINQGKGKEKQSLDDALRQLNLENESQELFDESILPSKNLQRVTYQAQQDIPDAIAGFQPDMDPRLREVLEALEDDAYVDDEDDDVFKELAKDSQELDEHEFDETYPEYDDDEGWESDHTAKPAKEFRDDEVPQLVDTSKEPPVEGPSQDWMEDFKKFKSDEKSGKKAAAPVASEVESSIFTTTTNGGRKKKRKGALTNPSNYSMSSSILARTEQMGILDSRFEKIEEAYNEDMDEMGSVSAISSVSSVQGPVRADFDNILDDFLGSYTTHGKKHIKKGNWKTGTEQLDEIRRELGPARIRPKYR
ncbi:Low temperature viability protein [Thozetella sp. PMI_491]|nr:Low temperature viability protein [Thozetella sp. PMI_491]